MNGKWTGNKAAGYFTVEAVLVMPFVLWTILFVMYLQFFLYDRCCLEQDAGRLMLRGMMIQLAGKEERMREWNRQASLLTGEQLIAWENEEWKLRFEQDHMSVEYGGSLRFPFSNMGIGGEEYWSTKGAYECRVVKPVSFLRKYRIAIT